MFIIPFNNAFTQYLPQLESLLLRLPKEVLENILTQALEPCFRKSPAVALKDSAALLNSLRATCKELYVTAKKVMDILNGRLALIPQHLEPSAFPLAPANYVKHPSALSGLALPFYHLKCAKLAFQVNSALPNNHPHIPPNLSSISKTSLAQVRRYLGSSDPSVIQEILENPEKLQAFLKALPFIPSDTCSQILACIGDNLQQVISATTNPECNHPELVHHMMQNAQEPEVKPRSVLQSMEKHHVVDNGCKEVETAISVHLYNAQEIAKNLAHFITKAREQREAGLIAAQILQRCLAITVCNFKGCDWQLFLNFYTRSYDRPLLLEMLPILGAYYQSFEGEDLNAINEGLKNLIRDQLLIQNIELINIIRGFLPTETFAQILDVIRNHYHNTGAGYMWNEVIEPVALAQGLLNQPT